MNYSIHELFPWILHQKFIILHLPLEGKKVQVWKSWQQHRNYTLPSLGAESSYLEIYLAGRIPAVGKILPPHFGFWSTLSFLLIGHDPPHPLDCCPWGHHTGRGPDFGPSCPLVGTDQVPLPSAGDQRTTASQGNTQRSS